MKTITDPWNIRFLSFLLLKKISSPSIPQGHAWNISDELNHGQATSTTIPVLYSSLFLEKEDEKRKPITSHFDCGQTICLLEKSNPPPCSPCDSLQKPSNNFEFRHHRSPVPPPSWPFSGQTSRPLRKRTPPLEPP